MSIQDGRRSVYRCAVFHYPEEAGSKREWSALLEENVNTAWPAFVGVYEVEAYSAREAHRTAIALAKARTVGDGGN